MKSHFQEVEQYVKGALSGELIVSNEVIQACRRFEDDKKRLEFNHNEPDYLINLIEKTIVHKQGEDLDGKPLKGTPFLLQPWQKFIVYNLVGFQDNGIRRFTEAFVFIPRKNGKTSFIAALAWALSVYYRRSGSSLYIVAASAKQSVQSFNVILNSLKKLGADKAFRIADSINEHSISGDLDGGSIYIEALASNPDVHDSFNCNIAIADEIHAFKSPSQYNRFKEGMKAYTNKLMLGITTAGDNINSFAYRRLQYALKILNGTVQDDSLFCFVSKAEQDENGEVDYLNPIQHQKANPSYGITIRPQDMMDAAKQAQNDPQQRKDFLSRDLNIYTSSFKSYFNIFMFKKSDRLYDWSIEDLKKLKIKWYGGVDLSKMHDLTAACIYGSYKDVDIVISHAWFPIVTAHIKADEDNIPLFGWQDNGWLTMCNSAVNEYGTVVQWFSDLKKQGFKIACIGVDRKFAEEFYKLARKSRLKVVDSPQYVWTRTIGFRRIERQVIKGRFYYMHSEAFEYCVENVTAIEQGEDLIKYQKSGAANRIDIFDCAVNAAVQLSKDLGKDGWFGEEVDS